MFVLNLETQSLDNISDIKAAEEIEAQDDFAWMLDVAASEFFETVFALFEESLSNLAVVVQLKEFSFGEAESMFTRFSTDKAPFSSEELAKFQLFLDQVPSMTEHDRINLINNILRLRKQS